MWCRADQMIYFCHFSLWLHHLHLSNLFLTVFLPFALVLFLIRAKDSVTTDNFLMVANSFLRFLVVLLFSGHCSNTLGGGDNPEWTTVVYFIIIVFCACVVDWESGPGETYIITGALLDINLWEHQHILFYRSQLLTLFFFHQNWRG
jgi:hypothetical protein